MNDNEKKIKEFIEVNFKSSSEVGLDTDLFKTRVVDSIGIVELVKFLEIEFNVKIPFETVSIEDLKSINCMIQFIKRKTNEK